MSEKGGRAGASKVEPIDDRKPAEPVKPAAPAPVPAKPAEPAPEPPAVGKPAKDYDSTLARVAGNLLSGAPGSWLGVGPDVRRSSVDTAVETARMIVETIRKPAKV